jgi:hypothetical protein
MAEGKLNPDPMQAGANDLDDSQLLHVQFTKASIRAVFESFNQLIRG